MGNSPREERWRYRNRDRPGFLIPSFWRLAERAVHSGPLPAFGGFPMPRSVFLVLLICSSPPLLAADPVPSRDELLKVGVEQILKMQDPDGQWGYEGVYRVAR